MSNQTITSEDIGSKAKLDKDSGSDPRAPLKVSELVARLKSDVEEKHRHVRVVGEISSFKQWRSGHCYFDIKDDQATLPAVMFRPNFMRVPFAVTDGLLVLSCGHISIYKANARLQMIVETMEPLGQGALLLAFEQLKLKLSAEGIFDERYKKPIKTFNQCIGLITSSHGAVLRDMVRILRNRMPKVDIFFSPVRVQGAGSKEEIVAAIELLDGLGVCDVIIVGRGGGSLEDLWAFNEEAVVRAIFKAKTPIISAVGHETDFTMSDFVADMRAATPTHAATMVVPVIEDLKADLEKLQTRFKLTVHNQIRHFLLQVAQEKRRLTDPRVLLFRHWQRLDEASNRLQQAAPFRQLRMKRDALSLMRALLEKHSPRIGIKESLHQVLFAQNALRDTTLKVLVKKRQQFEQAVAKLDALSPLKVLGRGYSLIQSEDGKILTKRAQFQTDQLITIRIADGALSARITEVK